MGKSTATHGANTARSVARLAVSSIETDSHLIDDLLPN